MDRVGRVASLWRYPIKSMHGEELQASHVSERGLLGDRARALVDNTDNRVGSAKHPRKWGALLACHAAYMAPPQPDSDLPTVRLTFPDGTIARSDEPDIDGLLARMLGRSVHLATAPPPEAIIERRWPDVAGIAPDGASERDRVATAVPGEVVTAGRIAAAAPPGTFFDFAPIHLLTTATLARMRALYPGGQFAAPRFRPNLVIETPDDGAGFVENDWVGCTVAIGTQVVLRVIVPAPRCIVTTLPQGDLPRDTEILQTIAGHNRVAIPGLGTFACLGIYAQVIQPGLIRHGDAVKIDH